MNKLPALNWTVKRVAFTLGFVIASTILGSNAQSASAITLDLTDGNASAIFDTDSGFTDFTVDGVDQVFQVSSFIRAGSAGQEALVQFNPDSLTQNGTNGGMIAYSSPSFNYSITLEFLLTGGTTGNANLQQTTNFTNTSGAPSSFALFNYNDLDAASNLENDTAAINPGTFVTQQTDGTTQLAIALNQTPSLVQVGTDLPSTILNILSDSSITNLDNSLSSGAPLSDGRNFGYQFNGAALANDDTFSVTQTISATQTATAVPFEFSPTLGLLTLAGLFGGDKLRKLLKSKGHPRLRFWRT